MFSTIGTDTELFARRKDGHHVALCGKIGGTKDNPSQIDGLRPGFAVQEDNVAVEFNIPPATTAHAFKTSIKTMLGVTSEILKGMELILSQEVSVSFDKTELTHPTALMFGCEPDFNIWTRMENQKPTSTDANLRTAGGHVHVGTSGNIVNITQNMDLFLGVPSVILDDTPGSRKRRELYGKAGAMRPKSYGLEYRVLSNFWVFNPKFVQWVFDSTVRACSYSLEFTKAQSDLIQKCINTGNKELAQEIMSKFEVDLPVGA